MALAHLRPGTDHLLELLEVGLGLAGQPDKGKDLHRIAQGFGIDIGVVAADDPLFLEDTDTAQAGRRGNAGTLGEVDIRHSAIVLQITEDLAINRIQLYLTGHAFPTRSFPIHAVCQVVWPDGE